MRLRDRDWYLRDAETRQFGIQFTNVQVEEAAAALRATPYDLVI